MQKLHLTDLIERNCTCHDENFFAALVLAGVWITMPRIEAKGLSIAASEKLFLAPGDKTMPNKGIDVFDFKSIPSFEKVAPPLSQFQSRDGSCQSYRFYDSSNKDTVIISFITAANLLEKSIVIFCFVLLKGS
jgi:hypothetical protein